VRRVFNVLQQARDSVKAAANGFHGQLRVALSDGITPSRLPELLALCRREEPEVEIRFFEVPLSQQIKGLHDGLYDVGFAQADEVGDGIVALPVWNDVFMVVVPVRHPLQAHKGIPLDELLRYPLVLCDPLVCLEWLAIAAYAGREAIFGSGFWPLEGNKSSIVYAPGFWESAAWACWSPDAPLRTSKSCR